MDKSEDKFKVSLLQELSDSESVSYVRDAASKVGYTEIRIHHALQHFTAATITPILISGGMVVFVILSTGDAEKDARAFKEIGGHLSNVLASLAFPANCRAFSSSEMPSQESLMAEATEWQKAREGEPRLDPDGLACYQYGHEGLTFTKCFPTAVARTITLQTHPTLRRLDLRAVSPTSAAILSNPTHSCEVSVLSDPPRCAAFVLSAFLYMPLDNWATTTDLHDIYSGLCSQLQPKKDV